MWAEKLLPTLSWLIVSFGLTRLLLPAFLDFLAAHRAVRINWQGLAIPGAVGIIFPPVFSLTVLGAAMGQDRAEDATLVLLALFGTAFFGLLDDLLGNTKPKGLKGHFSHLWLERRITSGFIKAAGISVLSFLVVWQGENLTLANLADWLLLVLSVNFVNLLDLRPGRALKAVIIIGLCGFWTGTAAPLLVGSTLGMSLAYLPLDLAGAAMLGDTGSNSLGILTGLILLTVPWSLKIILLVILLTLQILAEYYSFSTAISANRWLAALDNWGRAAGRREGESSLNVERITKR